MKISEAWHEFHTIAEMKWLHSSITIATRTFKFIPYIPSYKVTRLSKSDPFSCDVIPFLQWYETHTVLLSFYAREALASRGNRASGLSVSPSIDQVKIFVQGRILRPINGSKLIFHTRMYLYETSRKIQEPWPHDLYFMVHWLRTGQVIKVKIFVQGRILSSTNGSKLIFHIRMYFYETSGTIQEPWPHDLYFTVC